MSDVIARLQAADPLAGQPYEHPNLSSVITNITRTPRVATSVWRRFQLRFCAAVTGTTLVTVGAIAALQGAGSSLPILNFAAPVPVSGVFSAAAVAPVSSTSATIHFTLTNSALDVVTGAHPAPTPTSALAFKLAPLGQPGAEASRIAHVFGLSAASSKIAPGTWRVQGAHGMLTYLDTPLATWTFVRPVRTLTVHLGSTGSANLRALAATLNAALGFDDQLGVPTVTTRALTITINQSAVVIHTTKLDFPVLAHGTHTSLSTSFSFSSSGALLGASGPAFSLSSSYNYPVVSPRDGVRLLNDHQLTPLPSSSTNVRSLATSPQFSTTHHATFTRAKLSLNAFRLRGGTVWLVPVYNFSGTVDGQPTTLSLLALAPHFLSNAASATPLVGGALSH